MMAAVVVVEYAYKGSIWLLGFWLMWGGRVGMLARIIGLSGGRIVLDALTSDVSEEYIRKIYDGHSNGLFFNN